MRKFTHILTLAILLLVAIIFDCAAQVEKQELSLLGKKEQGSGSYETRNIHYKSKIDYVMPTHLLSKGLMLVYRDYISVQISADCAFDMSCSVFAINAINQYGLVKGLLLAADRLTRCGFGTFDETAPYLIKTNEHKIIDHPEFL